MKRAIAVLAAVLIGTPVFAVEVNQAEYRSDNYLVRSYIGQTHAEQTAERMEALFNLYNAKMRFERDYLDSPLQIRVFAGREEFETYLETILGAAPEEYVYLHYRNPERNELVAYAREHPEYGRGLAHQGFVQFLRAFVSDPPIWLQEGLAVYFEHTEYDKAEGTTELVENLSWLDTARALYDEDRQIELEAVLTMGPGQAEEELERFYPQAWALVSFLLHAEDRAVTRLLWDSVSALRPGATREQNVAAIQRAAFDWVELAELETELAAYLQQRRSPVGLTQDGVELYAAGELQRAEELFLQAAEREPDNHAAYYYLGLINYDEANYGLAEYYYMRAAEVGADDAVVQYALGVNAFAAGRYGSAKEYLETAIQLDADRYRDRAEQLLSRIPR